MSRLGLLALCIYFIIVTMTKQVACMEYFIPASGDPCTSPPCCMLSEFAANSSLNLTSGITLILAPGRHYLNVDLTLSNLEYISIFTDSSAAQIVCENNSHFTFDNSMSINVTNINFLGCGYNTVIRTRNLVIYNTTFEGHKGSGTALLVWNTIAWIAACKFLSNAKGFPWSNPNWSCHMGSSFLMGSALVSINSTLTIKDSCFHNNEAECYGALFLYTSNVTIDHSNFTKNSGFSGGAVSTNYGTLNITSSLFHENMANMGGGAVQSLVSSINVTDSNFIGNTLSSSDSFSSYRAGGGIHLVSSNVTFINCGFINSSATFGGAIFSVFGMMNIVDGNLFYGNKAELFGGVICSISTMILINGSQFYNNIGGLNGTHSMLFCSICTISMENVLINDNFGSLFISNSDIFFQGQVIIRNNQQLKHRNIVLSSRRGGAVTLIQSNATFFGKNKFESNEAENGGAVYSYESRLYVSDDFVVVSNKANNGGGIYLYQSKLICQHGGICNININDNIARQNGGGIHAISSIIKVTVIPDQTAIIFCNNSAQKGGGLFMEMNAKLYVFKRFSGYTTAVRFTENSAKQLGGAVYVDDGTYFTTCNRQDIDCFIQVVTDCTDHLLHQRNCYPYEFSKTISFEHNHANLSTHDPNLFGGLLHRCAVSPYAALNLISNFSQYEIKGIDYFRSITHLTLNQTSSYPVAICQCINQEQMCETIKNLSCEVKKGDEFSMSIVAVDQAGHPVPAIIQSSFSNGSSSLEGQLKQPISGSCSVLKFNIRSNAKQETLSLYASDGPCKDAPSSTFNVTINFLPCTCPVGFQPSNSSDVNCTCECHEDIAQYVNECDIQDQIFVKECNSTTVWISIFKDEYVIYPNCPYDYCISSCSNPRFTFNQTNDLESAGQCSFNRSKLLCGSCKPGFSLSLGSSQCIQCPKYWPALFVILTIVAAIAGFALIAVLRMLNMSVTVGTLNGLIFYANILSAHKSILLPSQQFNPFVIIVISWLNMDFGIDCCYIKGMDTYAKTWLQLGFPFFVYFLIALVIIVSSYSFRFSKVVGKRNPVATLATLILISYAKLLEVSFGVLSIGIVDYPNRTQKHVWLRDATVEYFGWKYSLLFVMSVIILLLGLIYTVLLFSWQWLLRLPKWKIFKWVRNQKLHAFIETYHVPYKSKYRYWTGLLLFARTILYLVAAVNFSNDPKLALTSISLVVGIIFLLKGLIGRIYQNKLVDTIETLFYFNILVFTTLTWYAVDKKFSNYNLAVIYISVLEAFIVLLLIILYHFYVYTSAFSKLHRTSFGKKLDAMLIAWQTTVKAQQEVPFPYDNIHAFSEFLDQVSGPATTTDYEMQPRNRPAEPTKSVVEIEINE